MRYRVVARFFHRASGAYIDPGQDCPLLPVEDAQRLVRARCLVEVKGGAPAGAAPVAPAASAPPAPRRGRPSQGVAPPSQGTAPPQGQEASQPPKE